MARNGASLKPMGRPEVTHMTTQNVSWIEKLRAPPSWLRGLYVAVLALILLSDLALITFSWAPQRGARIYSLLALLWILASVALIFLLRLWRTTISRGKDRKGQPRIRT